MKNTNVIIIAVMLVLLPAKLCFAQNATKKTELSPIIEKIMNIFPHDGAPDSLYNDTKVAITVEIKDVAGRVFPGLWDIKTSGGSKDTTEIKDLKSGAVKLINSKKLRRGVGINKKVELIVTIPGVKRSSGTWDLKQVKWNLGKDHQPSYTKLNYIGRKEGYQVIFVYENGLNPLPKIKIHQQQDKVKESMKMRRVHFEGHFCEPTDPGCY